MVPFPLLGLFSFRFKTPKESEPLNFKFQLRKGKGGLMTDQATLKTQAHGFGDMKPRKPSGVKLTSIKREALFTNI